MTARPRIPDPALALSRAELAKERRRRDLPDYDRPVRVAEKPKAHCSECGTVVDRPRSDKPVCSLCKEAMRREHIRCEGGCGRRVKRYYKEPYCKECREIAAKEEERRARASGPLTTAPWRSA